MLSSCTAVYPKVAPIARILNFGSLRFRNNLDKRQHNPRFLTIKNFLVEGGNEEMGNPKYKKCNLDITSILKTYKKYKLIELKYVNKMLLNILQPY